MLVGLPPLAHLTQSFRVFVSEGSYVTGMPDVHNLRHFHNLLWNPVQPSHADIKARGHFHVFIQDVC